MFFWPQLDTFDCPVSANISGKAIQSFSHLQHLNLQSLPLPESTVEQIAGGVKDSLVELGIACHAESLPLICSNLVRLEKLTLNNCDLKASSPHLLDDFHRLHQLESLKILRMNVFDEEMLPRVLRQCPRLRELETTEDYLAHFANHNLIFKEEILAQVPRLCPLLETFSFSSERKLNLKLNTFESFPTMEHLKSLTLKLIWSDLHEESLILLLNETSSLQELQLESRTHGPLLTRAFLEACIDKAKRSPSRFRVSVNKVLAHEDQYKDLEFPINLHLDFKLTCIDGETYAAYRGVCPWFRVADGKARYSHDPINLKPGELWYALES